MKSFRSISSVFLIACFLTFATAEAHGGAVPEVAEAAICQDVVQRTPVDIGTEFSASAGSFIASQKSQAPRTPPPWFMSGTLVKIVSSRQPCCWPGRLANL